MAAVGAQCGDNPHAATHGQAMDLALLAYSGARDCDGRGNAAVGSRGGLHEGRRLFAVVRIPDRLLCVVCIPRASRAQLIP